jgi:hypothetical protein
MNGVEGIQSQNSNQRSWRQGGDQVGNQRARDIAYRKSKKNLIMPLVTPMLHCENKNTHLE